MIFSILWDMLLDEVCRVYLWLFDRRAFAALYVVPEAYRQSEDAEAVLHFSRPSDISEEGWLAMGANAQKQASVLWTKVEELGWTP